jgi:hypothetical protein
MRALGILLLSLTPFLFGLDYSNTLKKQKDFLLTFKEFVLFVKDQIRFSGRERNEIITLALNDVRFNTPIFKNIESAFKTGENLTKIISNNNYIRLNSKEIYEIEAFALGLGKNDTEGQLNHCDYYFSVFDTLVKKKNDDVLVKSRLCIGLTLSLSALIFIIMI